MADKTNCLVGKISGSGVQNIKAPVAQNKSTVTRGNDLRTGKGK